MSRRELAAAGISRPAGKGCKQPSSAKLKTFWKKVKSLRTKILRRKNPDLFCTLQFDSSERWNRLGLVQVLSEKNVGIPISVVKKCHSYLRALAEDEAYAGTWKEPELFRLAVKNMLSNIESVLEWDRKLRARFKHSRCWQRRRGPRLIYDAFFRAREGERRQGGAPSLLPIPQRKTPRRQKA